MRSDADAALARAWLLDYIRETGSQPTVALAATWLGECKGSARRYLRDLVLSGDLVAYDVADRVGFRAAAYRLPSAAPVHALPRPTNAAILAELRARGSMTTSELADIVGVSRRRVAMGLAEMDAAGVVRWRRYGRASCV